MKSERAIVVFADTEESYIVFLPTNGGVKKVASVLEAAIITNLTERAGLVAARFLVQVPPKVAARLASPVTSHQVRGGEAELRYVVCLTHRKRDLPPSIRVIVSDRVEQLFNGTFVEFLEWARCRNNADKTLHGKIVKFFYNGGSEAGNRVVKVEEIVHNGPKFLLRGKDLHKEQYRAYDSDKIHGELQLVG